MTDFAAAMDFARNADWLAGHPQAQGPLSVRLVQLYALRAQLDAIILAEEQSQRDTAPQADPEGCPNCGAPADKQVPTSTLDGTKSVICIVCRVPRPA